MTRTREPRAPAPVLRNESRAQRSGSVTRCRRAYGVTGSRVLPRGSACGLHSRKNPVVSALESY